MRLKWLLIVVAILGGGVSWSGEIEYNFEGEYRYRQNWVSDFPTDERGRELGQEFYQESRLRANFQIQANSLLQVNLQADFFTGLLEGDEADLGLDYARWPWDSLEEDYQEFVFRQFWAEWTSKVGIFRLGQMSSHWGLGILANNGEGEDNLFGDTYFGDLVHRIMFASKPLLAFSQNKFAQNWVIAVAYDQVYLDENADYRAGDRAYQWIFSTFYQELGRMFAGVYVVLRDQEDADGDEVEAQVYDLYLNYIIPAKGRVPQITLSFEGAYLEGFTDRVIHENAREGIDLEGLGAVARVDLGYKDLGLKLRLEAGYASGDANFYDDKNFSFSFDPDYNVGLVLFDEVIAGISAVAPETIADPSRIYVPQKGIDILPTNGSLTNVIYQMFGFSYIPAPVKGLEVKGAVIYAQSDQYFSDPYQTYKAGGVAHNFLGDKCDSKELGWELDFGLSYTLHIAKQLSLKIGGEYGKFFPGGAFKDQEGERMDPVEKIRALFSLNW